MAFGLAKRVLVLTSLLSLPASAWANQTGINGRSGKYNRFCITCHTGGGYDPVLVLNGPDRLFAHQRASYTLTVSANALPNAVGFNAAVERQGGAIVFFDPAELDPRDDDDGTIVATDPGTHLLAGEVSHTGPRPFWAKLDLDDNGIPDGLEDDNGNAVQDGLEDNDGDGHPDGQQVSFTFQWEAHQPGLYDIYVAANVVDRGGTDQNDHPRLLPPITVTVCDDADFDGVCCDDFDGVAGCDEPDSDNCPSIPNPKVGGAQPDCDFDGIGDACDTWCSGSFDCLGRCYPGFCGDWFPDSPAAEDCDYGGFDDGQGCGSDCKKYSVCSDGIWHATFEECDEGEDNSDTAPDGCRSDCRYSRCGDGVVSPAEQCDDGNTTDDGNGCTEFCVANNTCGDGVVQTASEDCDDDNEQDDLNGCSAACKNSAVCGNGNLEALFEDCDDGTAVDEGNGCGADCRFNNICGDGVVAPGIEDCDDGDDVDSGNGCDTLCTRYGSCGDGVRHSYFEQCDTPLNSDTSPDRCRTTCQPASCGDGVVDSGEQCDQGLANSDSMPDRCRSDCTPARCGDGFIDGATVPGGEECDDGAANANLPGACRANCLAPVCGDGITDANEECDDGDQVDGDGCSALCRHENCGDGFRAGGEECDEGGDNSDTVPDACRTNCKDPSCGDGVHDRFEGCDKGENNSDLEVDGCRRTCRPAFCGDGVVDSAEQCDPESGTPGQTCTESCTLVEESEAGCVGQGQAPAALLLAAVLLVLGRRRSRY